MPNVTPAPIWRDTYYETGANTVKYRIELDGATIFSGRAVRYPGDEYMSININRVCRNYLSSDLAVMLNGMPLETEELDHYDAQHVFNLYVNDVNVEDYRFYNDYSYTTEKSVTNTTITSEPINGHYVSGMLKVRTRRTPSRVYSEVNADDDPGLGYDTMVECHPYVLYYLNSFGGWDAFVIEGNTSKKDTYTTYMTDQSFNNTTLEFEQNKHTQEIKTSYELNTGWLSDSESSNLAKNLLGSLKVYLQNTVEGWVRPVVITDSSVSYQTYQGNNRKLCQYKINVAESQQKLRK